MKLNPAYETTEVNGHYLLVNTKTDEYFEIDQDTFHLTGHLQDAREKDQERLLFLKNRGIILEDGEQAGKQKRRKGFREITKIKLFSFRISGCFRKGILKRAVESPALPRIIRICSVIGALLTAASLIYLMFGSSYMRENATADRLIRMLPAVYLLSFLITCFHELGHVLLCRHYCGYVGRCGVMLFFFMPAFYTNTTVAAFAERKQRLEIIMAGVSMQLAAAGLLSVLTVAAVMAGSEAGLLLLMLNIINFLYIFMNLNPLFKYDGYWLLSVAWDISYLYEKSVSEVLRAVNAKKEGRQICRRLFVYGVCLIGFYIVMWTVVIVGICEFLYPVLRLYCAVPVGIVVFLIIREMLGWGKAYRRAAEKKIPA